MEYVGLHVVKDTPMIVCLNIDIQSNIMDLGGTYFMAISVLKEWAIVRKGLEEGRKTILLRISGIMEYKYGFELRHSDFYVFLTYEHQSTELLQPEYISRFASVLQYYSQKEINTIDLFAKVSCRSWVEFQSLSSQDYQDNVGEPVLSNDISHRSYYN